MLEVLISILKIPKIKIGQVWEHHPSKENANNPFIQTKIRFKKVLDFKKGYVKYMWLDNKLIDSCEQDWFRINSKLKSK